MNDLQEELQELKAKVAELETRILFPNEPVAKWQPKGGDWYVSGSGKVFWYTTRTQGYREFGTERDTEEQAQRASVEMRRFNRLLSLRDELCGDEVVDWKDIDFRKYYLFFNHNKGKWASTYHDTFSETITPYFTTKELAQKACDMLNSGEVEL